MLTPTPQIQQLALNATESVYVIDDALLEPERWVERAMRHRDAFEQLEGNAFPGPELRLPQGVTDVLAAFLTATVRQRLGARRVLRAYSRLSMVTRAPEALQPWQWICHRDLLAQDLSECVIASVLYLFQDTALGGTSFYRPTHNAAITAQLVHDSGVLAEAEFQRRYGIEPGYLMATNHWFERVLTVPPRFNRLIFYSGEIFHSSHISAPERLSADPARGRLTLNGFFVCRRQLQP